MEISRLVKIGKGFGKEVGLERPGSIGSILPGFFLYSIFLFLFFLRIMQLDMRQLVFKFYATSSNARVISGSEGSMSNILRLVMAPRALHIFTRFLRHRVNSLFKVLNLGSGRAVIRTLGSQVQSPSTLLNPVLWLYIIANRSNINIRIRSLQYSYSIFKNGIPEAIRSDKYVSVQKKCLHVLKKEVAGYVIYHSIRKSMCNVCIAKKLKGYSSNF